MVAREIEGRSLPLSGVTPETTNSHVSQLTAEFARVSPAQDRRSVKSSRVKPHLAWEQHELTTHGFYGRYLDVIFEHFPNLTVTEARVAALAAGLLPSREIARILGITEHSVENYRSHIRKKIELPKHVGLTTALQRLILQSFTKK